MKSIPFNKLVAPERDYIAYELSHFSSRLIGIYQPLKKNYRIELQYMEAWESRQGMSIGTLIDPPICGVMDPL
jgi:hypothetical protein